jgi:Ca2+:H+ antiporter
MLNILLIFVPVAIALERLRPEWHTAVFITAAIGIVPLAGWLGTATEHLAHRAGEGVGGLLNATFGNAAELIIALVALQKGLYDVVKASLTGSIIGNTLLVLGASVVAGGLKFKEQRFNLTAARAQSTLLTLTAIAFVMPAAFHYLVGPEQRSSEHDLSLEICIVLLVTYAAHLVFSLITHKQLFSGEGTPEDVHTESEVWPVWKAIAVLAAATAILAWLSEILVGSVEPAAASFGMTRIFVGVIVVAVIGNAAEHSTAIIMALRNRMDLALGISMGSSIQIALFVAPLLVIASHFIGPRSMDLVLSPAEVLSIFAAVLIMGQIAGDGESNWLEGVQLLAVYLILALVFFFLPETIGASH